LKDEIFNFQNNYYCALLKKFNMNSSIEDATPMVTNFYLNTDEGGKPVDQTTYRGMIGSHYLITSRPNIMSFVCVCARFQANPKEQHLIAIKRILKYLKGNYVV